MLAPVFDSLMSLYVSALGRRLRIGEGAVVSEDEHLLLNLLGGSQRACARLERNDGLAVTLRCALCSTRIMMRLALDCGAPPTNGSYPG
jgi:hypothetical protein